MIPWPKVLQGHVDRALLQAAAEGDGDPARWLLERGGVAAAVLRRALSLHYEVPSLDLAGYSPEEEALALVDEAMARRLRVLPLFRQRNRLYVAVTDPDDLAGRDLLSQTVGMAIGPVVVLAGELEESLTRCYAASPLSGRAIQELAAADARDSVPRVEEINSDAQAPAAQIWQQILAQAFRLGASDVHLHPFPTGVQMRCRVDGVLRDLPAPPLEIYPALVSRLKIDARLDIAERRRPQDGRSQFRVEGKTCDLRVSIIPTLYGEGVVARLLPGEEVRPDLDALGFPPDTLQRFERLARRPHGMMLVTGPTGSGKSTTLYALLERLINPETHVVTLEDPVEARIGGITQIQMNAGIGLTFPVGLRAVLRHDPDVIMVGEIRDLESAEIAVRSALTGHFLLSTLHTNSSLEAVTRLVDVGVAPYLVRSVLAGVLAQRLIRRLCPRCRVEREVTLDDLELLAVDHAPPGAIICEPRGCEHCHGLGYRGRLGIYELLEFSPAMRRLSDAEMSGPRLGEEARRVGFRTLREEARARVFEGVTSVREALRITAEEE